MPNYEFKNQPELYGELCEKKLMTVEEIFANLKRAKTREKTLAYLRAILTDIEEQVEAMRGVDEDLLSKVVRKSQEVENIRELTMDELKASNDLDNLWEILQGMARGDDASGLQKVLDKFLKRVDEARRQLAEIRGKILNGDNTEFKKRLQSMTDRIEVAEKPKEISFAGGQYIGETDIYGIPYGKGKWDFGSGFFEGEFVAGLPFRTKEEMRGAGLLVDTGKRIKGQDVLEPANGLAWVETDARKKNFAVLPEGLVDKLRSYLKECYGKIERERVAAREETSTGNAKEITDETARIFDFADAARERKDRDDYLARLQRIYDGLKGNPEKEPEFLSDLRRLAKKEDSSLGCVCANEFLRKISKKLETDVGAASLEKEIV